MELGSSKITRRSRRELLLSALTATAAASFTRPCFADCVPASEQQPDDEKTIGIQVGAVSFVDEGVERVLDNFQRLGAVNTIFLTTFTYGRGLSGRQIPGQPFPDHGVQESDENFFHGGNYATPHPEFYKDTILKQVRAPDFVELDILNAVLPEARKRGMKVFCSCEDQWKSSVPGFDQVSEEDLYGRKVGTLCLMHPAVRNFWTALVTDLCTSYDIDGILFFNERNGPLLNAIGTSHFQRIASSNTTCFCPHHRRSAEEQGIDFERARTGYKKLDEFVQATLADKRSSDGYFVEFWRLLVDYPEIIVWDKLFDFGKHLVLAEVCKAVKAVNPNLKVGFHVEHVNSFNPIFRATRRYSELAAKADFLKVVVYNNCGGERYRRFISNVGSTLFRDVPAELLLQFNNHLLGYSEEADLKELPQSGLSPDYVARETKRALAGVQGQCRIFPGIDIGIPTAPDSRKAFPEDTYAAVTAALRAGADGLIFSRKYSEMQLANLAAAGSAVREFAG
jgi:hypothetical protein